jgi:flagellar biogenesis protein FliO
VPIVLWVVMVSLCACGVLHAQDTQPQAEKGYLANYKTPQPLVAESPAQTFFVTLAKLVLTLVVTIILIYVTVYVLKVSSAKYRPMHMMHTGLAQIIDSLTFGPNKTMYVVNVADKRIVIACASDKEITCMQSIDDPQVVTEIVAQARQKYEQAHTFGAHLKNAQRKNAVKESLAGHISEMTSFFQGFKARGKK